MIRIAEQFSRTPGARYRSDGPFSGEEFRKALLEPAFVRAREADARVRVELDGTSGYATSFLEEAFGGLARQFGPIEVEQVLTLISEEDPSVVAEALDYIRQAERGA